MALTSGEPAGIGPELCLMLARESLPCEVVVVGDATVLAERARQLRLPLPARHVDIPTATAVVPGRPDPANSRYVLQLLDRAIDGTLAREFDAIVTAPVHKAVINDAGIPFSGHTEYLAARCGGARPVMLFAAEALRVALATTHLPLRAVSDALSVDSLCETVTTLAQGLARWFRLPAARIALCGLNPHAGEGGHLGDEEQRIITPAIERLRAAGVDARGPFPADTVFLPRVLADFDAVLAMYHDQALPVVKHMGFERTVNVTLGLPLLRTSPDHGTALDLAGSGRADPASLRAAVLLAAQLVTQRP
ncbi:MAG: 4-hydroxythreonine-4-phosphate dehydrogenase PdxA [Proteobacteria bacterium]|nr:4-hydroxythreonine-4-phosphate dehydrogenase PdxA [Pseudomonadota bacterium]